MLELKNFFDIKEDELKVLNPYDFNKSIQRIKNLTLDDIKNDLNNYQKKEFEFRTYEEEVSYSLSDIKFVTSSKNDNGENDYYLLKDLKEYLVRDEDFNEFNENKNKENKKISLEIKNLERGKKEILLIMYVDPKKLSENILKNFISKSTFDTAKTVEEGFYEKLQMNNKGSFRLTIKINLKYLNKIYHNKNKGQYFFDLQSPPIFRTNFFNNKENEKKNIDSNCIFPFRNFGDEFANLEYRHFIIMIEKDPFLDTPRDEYEINENFDTNQELNNSLENLFKNKNGDAEKYIEKEIVFKIKDKRIKDLNYYINFENNGEVNHKLSLLRFTKNYIEKNVIENPEENDENVEDKDNENQVIKLFYQVLALVSECILSYYNAARLLDNLLNGTYRNGIYELCRDEDFPKFFNLTLNKILDKYQNSLEEKSLKEFEEEIKNTYELLYAQYETEGLEEISRPSKNRTLERLQRCIITPTYILFTPYVLGQGNRVLREYIKSTDDTFLCNFKMDSMGSDRWDNDILVEFMKFILSKGFTIDGKNYSFLNYSQSQFRNLSCWLSTNPEKIIKKLGDFSKVKPVCKYAARISQTLTTTIRTIKIPKDKIKFIKDIKNDKYVFSDGVGKISYILAKKINDEFLKLDYVPSCFQGRFMGCKGVWTTMWDDNSGQIYCRDSQKKFDILPDDKRKYFYFELCDYSRYIPSYLNRQVILLLNTLGIKPVCFINKLDHYHKKLENQKFVLSLVHYPEWNRIFNKMYSCGINRYNDRLIKALVESNLNILYNDLKNKARIYVEESAYVKGIMDEFGILEYGEAYLHIKRDNLDLILDRPCSIAKCPCLHPGDIRVLQFKKYNKNDEKTKKYEVFNRYENVLIFPSKGERPHPNESSGSDLDGDDYFVFYDLDLVPEKMEKPMNYDSKPKPLENPGPYTINDVISYFSEYTNYNNLGLISDAHSAFSDKEDGGAKSKISRILAEKFSAAVDAPKTGDKVKLEDDENPKEFPHFMEKNKNKSYHSKNILGQLYDKSKNFIFLRHNEKYLNSSNSSFYDENLKLNGWENYAFLALIYYRDYFNEMINMLKKNEINGETVLLTGNNIDNENSIFEKKKNNYDIREKIGYEIHYLFFKNQNTFYNAINEFLINDIKIKENKINEKDLFNISLICKRNLNLFASACYMISYNLLEDVLNKKINNKPIIDFYCEKFISLINDNLIADDTFESINEISEYESSNIGMDYYENVEMNYDYTYKEIIDKKNLIKDLVNKKKDELNKFIKELKRIPIPKQANDENQYRILSFPWCISGNILSIIKYINYDLNIK
jgi:RNA-dependent RNA polymerase